MRGRAERLHIRLGMDVYGSDGNEYIGSVVGVIAAPPAGTSTAGEQGTTGEVDVTAQTSERAGLESPPLVHEENHSTTPSAYQGKRQLGEESGPFPTIAVGNGGPVEQSAERFYATGYRGWVEQTAWFAVRPGRINLGVLTRPLYVPVTSVGSISMERIVLDIRKDHIPAAWRSRPTETHPM